MRHNPTEWDSNNPERNWHTKVFFGLHYDLHAGAEDTVLGAELTPEHLREELLKVRPDWVQCDCKGHPGYTSWPTETGSASPGIVRDALRIHRDVTRELGIPLVMHYSGVWDSRAVELHPDWARIGPNGERGAGNVMGTCNLGPYTDELMIPQMIELIEKYDVDGFWVDGENWATYPCYCERCRAAFEAETGIKEPPKAATEPDWALWAAFHRRLFEEHVRKYAEAVHEVKPTCQVCSNWMYTVAEPDEIKAPIDYQSGDFTPAWGPSWAEIESRFMDSRGLSWDLMAWGFGSPGQGSYTFKPAAHLCQEAACVIALGGALSIYDQPQRTGHLTGWHQDTLAEVARFCRARQPWCQGTEAVHEAAVLHCSAHFYHESAETLMAVWSGAHHAALGAMQALLDNQVQTEVLNEWALEERLADFKLVVIGEQTRVPASLKEKLLDWVKGGGKLLLSGPNIADDFTELAGVQPAGEITDGGHFLAQGKEATPLWGKWRPVQLAGAEQVAPFLSQQQPGYNATQHPAVTLNRLGEGLVLALHSDFFKPYSQTHYPRSRKLVADWLAVLAPEFQLALEAPPWIHPSLRSQEGRLLVHLVNLGCANPMSPTQFIVEEVPQAGPITVRLELEAEPARVYLAPSFEPVSWHYEEGLLTVEAPWIGILDTVVVEA